MLTYSQEALRKIRKSKKINQDDLAEKMDLPLSTYSKKEREGSFEEKEFDKIASILKVSKDLFFVQKENPQLEDFEGFISGNQVRAQAMLQALLKVNAEILAKLTDRQATIILSELNTEVTRIEAELMGEIRKASV